jgi:hypothetical protein
MSVTSPADAPADVERSYTMLEPRDVGDLLRDWVDEQGADVSVADLIAHFDGVEMFESLGAREARNAEAAYRQVFKERFGDTEGEPLTLVAVSSRMFVPKPVSRKVRHSLTVG